MPDARNRMLPLAALGIGALFAAVAGIGGVVAAICAALAQPAFALAISHWPWRTAVVDVGHRDFLRHALALLVLWSLTALVFAAVLAWPLAALLDSGSLAAALALSLVIGLALLVL